MCLVMTAAGAWVAARVVELFRAPALATAGPPAGGEAALDGSVATPA
jgi:hypothetical protein